MPQFIIVPDMPGASNASPAGSCSASRTLAVYAVIRNAFVAAALFFAAPTWLSSQTWSPPEQAIIDLVARCNDGWSESIQRKDFNLFTRACPETSDAVYWYTDGEAPQVFAGPDGVWSRASVRQKRASWEGLRAVKVQIHGDVALIYYSVVWVVDLISGEIRRNPSRRLTVFRRQNGRWLMAGGSIGAIR